MIKPVTKMFVLLVLVMALGSLSFAQDAKPSGDITLWGWKAAMDPVRSSGVLDDFKAEYPDINVNIVEYAPTDLYQQLQLAISSGVGAPDVSMVESSHLAQFVDFGGLADLSEQVQPYLTDVNQFKWTQAEQDGKYYAMPWDSGPVVLYYRRDVFEKAGLPTDPEAVGNLIATWNDYLTVCQTIQEKTGDPCFAQNKANNFGRSFEMMLWQQGLGYYDEQGKVTVDSPQDIATLEMLGNFWDANVLSDQLEWTDGWYAELADPNAPVATIVIAGWMGAFLKDWIAPGTEGKWGVALMPAMNAGEVRAANDGGSNFVIPDQSKNKDAAWVFTEFMLGQRDTQLKLFAASDFLPSLETTYDSPLFKENDPFFGGEKVRELYTEVAKEIPQANIYGPNYSLMNGYVATAIQKYATGNMSAADALAEAATNIRRDTGLQ